MAGGQTHPINHFYKLEPPVANRAALAAAHERSAQSYIPTRAAQSTLSLLTERRDSAAGDFLWLGDPPGAGKTHFLNYFLALRRRLAKASGDKDGRELILALDYSGPDAIAQLDNDILAALARELAGERRAATPLWRRIGAGAAFEVALGEARRAGVAAITVAVDMGTHEAPAFAADLVLIARASRRPSLTVVAAGLGPPPKGAVVVEVGPAGLAERLTVAVARARRLEPPWAAMAHLYQGVEIDPFLPEDVFPFHPLSLSALSGVAEPDTTIPSLARMVREVLAARKDVDRLVYPCDIYEAAEVRRIVEQRLGAEGRAALRNALAAALAMPKASRHCAEQIVRTLALAHLCEPAPALEIDQLWNRLPAAPAVPDASAPEGRNAILRELAARSSGAIRVTPVGAAFVPAAQSSPDVEEFNQALALLKLFEPGLEAVRTASELTAGMARLAEAMSNLIEETHSVEATLNRFALAYHTEMDPEVRRAINEFMQLLERGAPGLLEAGADEKYLPRAQAIVAAYRELAAAAAAVPGLLAMREYLRQTRLEPELFDPQSPGQFAAMATERRLLEAELGVRAPYSRARESVEARFEKFKWTYIESYRAAHEKWRAEMAKASALAVDIDRSVQALGRLNSIAALGEPIGTELAAQARQSCDAIRACGLSGQFNAYASALCPECGYVLGTTAPAPALAELMEKIRRALREKLTALSRGAIGRLIRKYDRAHRLDGFLKITQAAQTEALAAVLDDQLTAYLARLLKERGEIEGGRRSGR
jgi:hypothetical protein